MKTVSLFKIISVVSLIALIGLAGCEDFEYPEKENPVNATLNVPNAIHMLEGDETVLFASPTNLQFDWETDQPTVVSITQETDEQGRSVVIAKALVRGMANVTARPKGEGEDLIPAVVNIIVHAIVEMEDYVLDISERTMVVGSFWSTRMFVDPPETNFTGEFNWITSNPDVATVTSAGVITATGLGNAVITCNSVDFPEIEHRTIMITVQTIAPLRPNIITDGSLRIFGVDFDLGGRDVAWFDTTPTQNQGGHPYRANNGDPDCFVDMEGGGAGVNIGWIQSGEWLQYTIEVPEGEEGVYNLDPLVGINGGTRQFAVRYGKVDLETMEVDVWNYVQNHTTTSQNNPPSFALASRTGDGYQNYRFYFTTRLNTITSETEVRSHAPRLPFTEPGLYRIRFEHRSGDYNYAGFRLTIRIPDDDEEDDE